MVKGETYDLQLFESRAFRHFVNVFLNLESGITKGCTVTNNKTTIDISEGMFIICGGILRETTGTSNAVPAEAGYYRLVYEIDLSRVNDKNNFNQGSYKFIKGIGDYPGLIQNNLDNMEEGIYQLGFCQFRITDEGMQDFKDIRPIINYGIYTRQWTKKEVNLAQDQVYKLEEFENISEVLVKFAFNGDKENYATVLAINDGKTGYYNMAGYYWNEASKNYPATFRVNWETGTIVNASNKANIVEICYR